MAIGLFGTSLGATSDQDILDKIRQEQMARNRAMTSNLGKYAGLAQAGMEAAQGFNTSVGRLFGAEDPRLQKNSLLREAGDAVKARGVNMDDALATLKAFSEELMKRGLYQEATALVPQIQQAQRQAAGDVREQKRLRLEEERVRLAGEQLTEQQRAAKVREERGAQRDAFDQGLRNAELALRQSTEARQGRLTEAQIKRTLAEINNLNKDKYTVSTKVDDYGRVIVTAVNNRDPSDIKIITPGGTSAPPTPAGKVDKKDRPPLEDMFVTPTAP
jgi:hemerythrin superfamily protein